MRNPRFKEIVPNYRKKVLEITLQENKKIKCYNFPFGAFAGKKIGSKNKFVSIEIDRALNGQGARFVLEDGGEGDFPADLVLYYCDPNYAWSPLNQLKRALRERLKQAKLSIRVLAELLHTSPTQVIRLLDETVWSKQLSQLFHVAELAGCQIEFQLRQKPMA